MLRGWGGIPVPPPSGALPDSPALLETSGSLVGQATVGFWKPDYLQDGDAISTAPVTNTTIYVSSSMANALAGTYTYSGSAGTTSSAGPITVAAGTWYVWGVSSNANGASDYSHVLPITVT